MCTDSPNRTSPPPTGVHLRFESGTPMGVSASPTDPDLPAGIGIGPLSDDVWLLPADLPAARRLLLAVEDLVFRLELRQTYLADDAAGRT